MDTRNSDKYALQSTTMDLTWFCPKHFCNSCGVLEKLSVPLPTTKLPDYIYLHQASPITSSFLSSSCSSQTSSAASSSSSSSVLSPSPSSAIEQKSLKCCNLCPTSFCVDCEEALICQQIPSRLSSSPYFPRASNNAKSFFKTKKSTGVSCIYFFYSKLKEKNYLLNYFYV
jgi:hypothetical protein